MSKIMKISGKNIENHKEDTIMKTRSIEEIVTSYTIVSGMIRVPRSNRANGNWAVRNMKFNAYDISVVVGNPASVSEDVELSKFVAKCTGEKYKPSDRHEYYYIQVNDSNTTDWAVAIREAAKTGTFNGQQIIVNEDGTTNMWIAIKGFVHEKYGKDGGNPFKNIGRIFKAEIRIVDRWDTLRSTFCPDAKILSSDEWCDLNTYYNKLSEERRSKAIQNNSEEVVDD